MLGASRRPGYLGIERVRGAFKPPDGIAIAMTGWKAICTLGSSIPTLTAVEKLVKFCRLVKDFLGP
jgi:hypothetical protein